MLSGDQYLIDHKVNGRIIVDDVLAEGQSPNDAH